MSFVKIGAVTVVANGVNEFIPIISIFFDPSEWNSLYNLPT
jgi:hypothetical protein